jgi:uncharacterized protein (UPF0333 family)
MNIRGQISQNVSLVLLVELVLLVDLVLWLAHVIEWHYVNLAIRWISHGCHWMTNLLG